MTPALHVNHVLPVRLITIISVATLAPPGLLITPETTHATPARMVKLPSPDKLHALPARADKFPTPTTRNVRHAPPGLPITPQTTHATLVPKVKPPPPGKLHAPNVPPDRLPTPTTRSVKYVPPDLSPKTVPEVAVPVKADKFRMPQKPNVKDATVLNTPPVEFV